MDNYNKLLDIQDRLIKGYYINTKEVAELIYYRTSYISTENDKDLTLKVYHLSMLDENNKEHKFKVITEIFFDMMITIYEPRKE